MSKFINKTMRPLEIVHGDEVTGDLDSMRAVCYLVNLYIFSMLKVKYSVAPDGRSKLG